MQFDLKAVDCGERDFSLGGNLVERKWLQAQLRQLSQINNFRTAWALARQWLVIATAIALALGTLHHFTGHFDLLRGLSELTSAPLIIVIFAYLLAGVVIASRQHALAILMHDAAHYRLFTNRIANDLFSDLFCTFPNGLATSLYRRRHIAHHRFLNGDKDPDWMDMMADPDWRWPKTKSETLKLFVGDLLGLNLPKWGEIIAKWSAWPRLFDFSQRPDSITQRERFLFLGFWLVVAAFLTLTHGWLHFLVLWIVPQFTILNLFARMRSIAEHLGLENEHELNQSRHVDGTLLERLTIAPLNCNYHLDHHLFPSVPYYNLPKLHQLLMEDENYRTKAKIVPNYLSLKHGVLSELISNI
jgi:fatty acid desaturase